jgi:two-component system catabolic regulation response regulator CreB
MPHILLVEDEAAIADTLVYALETEHFEVTHVTTAGEALKLPTSDYQLAILDVGLPDISGFDLCAQIRKSSSLPVLFLTARD